MPYAVYSNTGTPYPFFVEEGVGIDPRTPTVVDELSDAMRFHIDNLRVVEVDKKGEEVPIPRSGEPDRVDSKELDKAVRERDQLAAKLSKAAEDADEARKVHAGIVETLESLIPSTASAIGAMSLDDLKTLADYRKVKVEGEGKAAYVEALSPKGDKPR